MKGHIIKKELKKKKSVKGMGKLQGEKKGHLGKGNMKRKGLEDGKAFTTLHFSVYS